MPLFAPYIFCESQHKNQAQKEKMEVLHGTVEKERHPAAELCACSGAGCVSSPKHTGQQSVINPEKRKKCCDKNTCDWTDMHLSCLILFPDGGNNNQF